MWLLLNFLSFPFSIWYIKSLRRDMINGGGMSPNMHLFGIVSIIICLISTVKSFDSF